MAGLQNAATKALRAAKDETISEAKNSTLFKDKSGATRKSIFGEVQGLRGFVQAGGVAYWLENGTPAHWIVAKGRALRFEMNGQIVFRQRVYHPGTAERPFMNLAREKGQRTLEYGLQMFTDYAIRKHNGG